ncbi:MAG: hypothetical protein KatS3mg115_1396 [Candidatus Poribacteria bacterium]|nr:MAG: hypothetical protein KatS3mg115_1396 [Candidatus Poribacteria bacterium]
MIFAGIHLGIQRTQVGLFDLDGRLLDFTQRVRRSRRSLWSRAREPVAEWWGSVVACWEELRGRGLEPDRVTAIGISGFDALVALDESGRPIGNEGPQRAWSPASLSDRVRALLESLGERRAQLHWVCSAKDTIALQLCGEVCSDPQTFGEWIGEDGLLLEARAQEAGLEPWQLPRITPPFRNAGYTTKEAEDQLGVTIGVPVIAGWPLELTGLLGLGFPAETPVLLEDAPVFSVVLLLAADAQRVPEVAHRWHLGDQGRVFAERMVLPFDLEWWAEAFGDPAVGEEELRSVLPGERLPLFRRVEADGKITGIWEELHPVLDRAELIYSVLEGAAWCWTRAAERMLEALPGLEDRGLWTARLDVDFWAHLLADLSGRALRTMAVPSAYALGAAMLAAMGVGEFETYRAVAERMAPSGGLVVPREDFRPLYARRRERYVSGRGPLSS